MTWKIITLDESYVRTTTDRSVLIAMPKYGKYSGYTFWHPAKLVRYVYDCYELVYNDGFQFRLQKREKNASGEWETTDTVTLSAGELCESILEEEPLIYTPQPLEPEEITADESLMDDE